MEASGLKMLNVGGGGATVRNGSTATADDSILVIGAAVAVLLRNADYTSDGRRNT